MYRTACVSKDCIMRSECFRRVLKESGIEIDKYKDFKKENLCYNNNGYKYRHWN